MIRMASEEYPKVPIATAQSARGHWWSRGRRHAETDCRRRGRGRGRRGSAWSSARWTACSRPASLSVARQCPSAGDRHADGSRAQGAAQLVDTFFDSGLFRPARRSASMSSDGLWRLVDVIAASPTVRAALSQQGLGFADQLGDAMQARSRKGDRRLERAADRRPSPRHGAPQIPARGDEDGSPLRLLLAGARPGSARDGRRHCQVNYGVSRSAARPGRPRATRRSRSSPRRPRPTSG